MIMCEKLEERPALAELLALKKPGATIIIPSVDCLGHIYLSGHMDGDLFGLHERFGLEGYKFIACDQGSINELIKYGMLVLMMREQIKLIERDETLMASILNDPRLDEISGDAESEDTSVSGEIPVELTASTSNNEVNQTSTFLQNRKPLKRMESESK